MERGLGSATPRRSSTWLSFSPLSRTGTYHGGGADALRFHWHRRRLSRLRGAGRLGLGNSLALAAQARAPRVKGAASNTAIAHRSEFQQRRQKCEHFFIGSTADSAGMGNSVIAPAAVTGPLPSQCNIAVQHR
jgi:hypothetical protein